MDKLILEFSTVFWEQDADWLNYISDGDIKWSLTLNYYKYTQVPILMMFNTG